MVLSRPCFTFHPINFLHARREAHDTQVYIPSSMNKYNCTAIGYHVDALQLLRITRHEMSQKPFVVHQYSSISASYTVDHSLSCQAYMYMYI